MRKASLAIAVLVACASVSIWSSCKFSCVHGSGKVITEQRKVTEFKKIEISGGFKIHLKQDSSLAVNVTGDDNLLKYITTSVEGDKLLIKSKKSTCDADSMVVSVGVHNLNELRASGAVEVSSDGKLILGDLNMHLAGATRVNLDMNAANVVTDGSGVSELNLKGQAASHKVESSGVAKINAFDFVVGEYTLNTAGVGKCKINVLKTLNVHSKGASEIEYKGSPSTVNNDKMGASKLTKVD
ncbi:MAG: head GIN domain-containing protein [Mucilaginibacter sp.]|uniref:head GIN domain-containing protein n=1 Tax=Mucilaginibacter sp. TaxID=1882438 RepID=UPI0031A27F52